MDKFIRFILRLREEGGFYIHGGLVAILGVNIITKCIFEKVEDVYLLAGLLLLGSGAISVWLQIKLSNITANFDTSNNKVKAFIRHNRKNVLIFSFMSSLGFSVIAMFLLISHR